MSYASGSLPEAFSLIIAAHISLCDHCRATCASYETLGGSVLDTMSGRAPLAPGSLEATLAKIHATHPPAAETATPPRQRADAVLPHPLPDYIGGGLHDIRWRPIGLGVRQAVLRTSKTATARLFHIPAGTAMPSHGHNGLEMTMVLQGAFQDENEYFARGDVETASSDLHHTPVADIHEDCICLAVTDAPLRFAGFLPKLAQRFLRI